MSRTSILAILASVGIVAVGPFTQDTEAFARAILSKDDAQLLRFAQQFPDSSYRNDAIRLACATNWVNGACGADSDVKTLNQGGGSTPVTYGDAA
jgi:hypothetical protein